ncbi:MAG: hypothetical protein HYZ75_12825 [Elusimicrobia bacterium]|nr:hypothetical protein [Elusimicrobiota bacterium]
MTRVSAAAPAALLAAFAALVCASALVDPDLWWHLAAGRDILAGAGIPRVEAWSHTLRGAPWVDFEWLAQVLLAGVLRLGGFEALVHVKAALCAAAVAGTFAAARREDSGLAGALLGSLLALSAVRLRAHARPELVSLVLLPLFLLAARARCRGRFPLWPLAALSALWANMHGGWPLGPGVLLLCAAGRAWETRSTRDPAARALALTAAACALASLLNPYGLGLHRVFLEHVLHPPAQAGIEEWMTEGLRHFPAFWLLLVGVAARLPLDLLRNRRSALFWTAVLGPLALLGLSGARFAPLFCLSAPVFMFSGMGSLSVPPRTRGAMLLASAALSVALLMPLKRRHWDRPVRWERTPREALAFLDREGLGGTLFNDYTFGGFVTWQSGGRRPVFQDGRYLFQDLLVSSRGAEPEADYALAYFPPVSVPGEGGLPRSPNAGRFPKERWALVWSDDAAQVFLRRLPRYAETIARLELRWADPGDPDFVAAQVRSGAVSREAALAELARVPGAAAAALAALLAQG